MYCRKCGSEIEEGNSFCPYCGTPIQNQEQPLQSQSQPVSNQEQPSRTQPMPDQGQVPNSGVAFPAKKPKKTGMIIGICVTAVVVITAIIYGVCALVGVGGRSYEETVNQFVNSMWAADTDSFLDTIPDGVVDTMLGRLDREELEMAMKNTQDDFPVTGPGYEPIIEITEINEYSGSDLKEVQEVYKKKLGLDVSEVKSCTVNLSFKNSSETLPPIEDLVLVKIGSSWYIDDGFSEYFSDMND